eukprot:582780-Prymnesium_polylepis.1
MCGAPGCGLGHEDDRRHRHELDADVDALLLAARDAALLLGAHHRVLNLLEPEHLPHSARAHTPMRRERTRSKRTRRERTRRERTRRKASRRKHSRKRTSRKAD